MTVRPMRRICHYYAEYLLADQCEKYNAGHVYALAIHLEDAARKWLTKNVIMNGHEQSVAKVDNDPILLPNPFEEITSK